MNTEDYSRFIKRRRPIIPQIFPNPHNRNFSPPAYLDDASSSQGRRTSGTDAQTTSNARDEPSNGTRSVRHPSAHTLTMTKKIGMQKPIGIGKE
jgi:hypothetical protein